MADYLKIGMLGCGQIMPSTAKSILNSKYCRMHAVFDIDAVAAQEKSLEYGIPKIDDLWEFLSDPDMDAVYIAVPHGWHAPLAVEAARAGKHILVEKPMVTDINDGRMLLRECNEAGIKLSVAMPLRLSSAYEKIREIIGQGLIGDVISTHIRAIGFKQDKYWSNGVAGNAKRSAWRAFMSQAGGGILIMNAIHNLDAMYYATGLKPVEVMAMGGTYTARAAVEDTISLLIRYHRGNAFGTCDAMSNAYGASHTDNFTTVYGTKGTIRFNKKILELFTSIEEGGFPTGQYTEVPLDEKDSRATLVDDFALSIFQDRQPIITGNDGLMIADLILSSYRSLKSGISEKLTTTDLWL